MYEDSWYSFVPDFQQRPPPSGIQPTRHRRKESLLQQPNGTADNPNTAESLPALFEDQEDANSPPQPTLSHRAKSYSDFHNIVKAQLPSHAPRKKREKRRSVRGWEALALPESVTARLPVEEDVFDDRLERELLQASQREYLLYHDELAMTERHLGNLIADANTALRVLESLSHSFRAVDEQTTSFQAQCEGLLTEQKRLQVLADSVGRDLQYYTYLDSATRRLNAPGAGRLVEGASFAEILSTLYSCIEFMKNNSSYRDAESYLARYQALLIKALHLLEVGFVNHLNKVSAEISRQITATQSESARHALAYGRFEEIVLESYSLIPNVQLVVRSAYDQDGQPSSAPNSDVYVNTASNLFHAYWAARERDLKPITQHDLDVFRAEAKESIETAARNFVKQCFERSYNEASLFTRIFSVDTQFSMDPNSVFAALKSQRSVLTGSNVAPIATSLQSVLQSSELQTICNLVGWITNEYLLPEYDDDETPFVGRCRELAARLLAEHLWTFTDAAFEAEVAKSISKATVTADALKIGPVTNGDISSNAFPPVKRALELLVMFDQSMPKERCQRNSPVIFKIIKESIASLQRAEGRIKSTKNGTDPDLFMVKNLLILKNELMTLEIGDVRGQASTGASASLVAGNLQHFAQIWDTFRQQNPLGGLLSSFGSLTTYIPGSSLWSSRSNTPAPGGTPALGGGGGPATTPRLGAAAGGGTEVQDASEQLDGLLRQSIYAFTKRWAGVLNEARGVGGGGANKLGGKNLAKIERELEEMLERAFGGQPEVVDKLKEAIEIEAQAQVQAQGEKRSYITRV
ncbi:Sec34-like family-domain-containing protein [Achaetomium macrosporum]|uniref:Conserved oligomeric Golgi complex subunit 3 n=1 Tax=Achaetomium macrosporum TaxID=79813 RepID=A0AAN7CIX0_9PEZI|nr:Sec34-like family-domain-containing protein [Achaetomium macrosporum]